MMIKTSTHAQAKGNAWIACLWHFTTFKKKYWPLPSSLEAILYFFVISDVNPVTCKQDMHVRGFYKAMHPLCTYRCNFFAFHLGLSNWLGRRWYIFYLHRGWYFETLFVCFLLSPRLWFARVFVRCIRRWWSTSATASAHVKNCFKETDRFGGWNRGLF